MEKGLSTRRSNFHRKFFFSNDLCSRMDRAAIKISSPCPRRCFQFSGQQCRITQPSRSIPCLQMPILPHNLLPQSWITCPSRGKFKNKNYLSLNNIYICIVKRNCVWKIDKTLQIPPSDRLKSLLAIKFAKWSLKRVFTHSLAAVWRV